jgi:hypothetical protein
MDRNDCCCRGPAIRCVHICSLAVGAKTDSAGPQGDANIHQAGAIRGQDRHGSQFLWRGSFDSASTCACACGIPARSRDLRSSQFERFFGPNERGAKGEDLERQRVQMEQRQREEAVQRERDEAEKRRQQDEIDKTRQDADNRQREIEQQRRRLAEDEQAKKKSLDEQRYIGPSSGTLTWEGQVNGLQLVEIENGSANVGTVTGNLPGVACLIQPANSKGVIIADPPRPANGFQRLVFRVQGKGHVAVRFSWVVQQAR